MNRFEFLYASALLALPVAAVVGLVGTYALGLVNLSILGLYLAVPMLAVSVVAWRLGPSRPQASFTALPLDWRMMSIAFHVVLSALALTLSASEIRPRAFFVGLAIMYLLCFLLVFERHDGGQGAVLSLYHIAVTLLVTVYSVTLHYDFFVGRTDLTAHISQTETIIETGQVVGLGAYQSFPLWHVYTALSSQLFGGWVAPHTTLYLLCGVVFAASVPAMYSLSRRVYPDERAALLSALVMIAYPSYIFYGMYSVSRSVTSVLFLFVLLTLVSAPSIGMRAVSVLLVVSIVLYHPVSIPFVAVILVILYAVERVLGTKTVIVDDFTLSVVALTTSVYWLYRAEYIVVRLVEAVVGTFFGPTEETTPTGVVVSPWAELANYASYSFLLFFVLLGVLLCFQTGRRRGEAVASLGLVTVIMLPLSLPGPTLLLDSLVGLNVERFGHYTYMFLAFSGGIGLSELVDRSGVRLFIALLVVLSLFSFTAVSNDFVATDNPVVERPFYTYYLTDLERHSFEAIDTAYGGQIGADRPACRYMTEIQRSDCDVITVEEGGGLAHTDHEGVLIRESEFEKRPLQFTEYVEDLPREELHERNRVYDSGAVSFYR
ncbi:hypothetical protein ACYJ1Y_02235 [Natrialbaceae archaeon A-gly3]